SYIQTGITHTRNRTDVAAGDPGNLTRDQESTSLYAQVNHRITSKLSGNILVRGQRSTFEGGQANNAVDYYLTSGVNLSYQFNPFLSTEVGYNYDRLDSDLSNRSFTRNRVYIGIRGTY
ncbi:MAG: outer membrane beta-barrel protein, partial [Verrucomicrobiota bacterium]